MSTLNPISLEYMFEKCSDNTRYRGMIVFNTLKDLKDFIKEFVDLNRQSAIPSVRIIKQRYNSGTIEFTNDSTIQLVLVSESARGIKCNIILFDDAIDKEMRDILRGCIIPYNTEPWEDMNKWARKFMNKWVTDDKLFEVDPMENVTDTGELDNFLNEFKIASKK